MYLNPMTDVNELTPEQAKQISKTWWYLLVIGLLSLIVGFMIIGATWTLQSIVVFFGVLLIARGLIQVFSASGFGVNSRTWNLVVGILTILVGLSVFVLPRQTLAFVAAFIGIWLVVTGTFDLIGSIAVRNTYPYWWLVLIRGIIAVPLGIWALGRPFQTLLVVILAIGIWAIMVGIIEIVMAFEVRRLPHTIEGQVQPKLGTT